jgi:hypothetical protein
MISTMMEVLGLKEDGGYNDFLEYSCTEEQALMGAVLE